MPKNVATLLILIGSILICRSANAYELVKVDVLGSDTAVSLSDNGKVVAGVGDFNGDFGAYTWTRETGARHLGSLGSRAMGATDISADGTAVTGYANSPFESFRWTEATGPVGLTSVAPSFLVSISTAISGDGNTVVGYTGIGGEAFRWRQQGVHKLGLPSGAQSSKAIDISNNGSVAAVGLKGLDSSERTVLWREGSDYVELGPMPAGWNSTFPAALSAAGDVLVGFGGTAISSDASGLPFRWTEAAGIHPLPTLAGGNFIRMRITPDASVVVANERSGASWIPIVWDEQHGTRRLNDLLANEHQVPQTDIFFDMVRGISADKRTLLVAGNRGTGDSLWILNLDKPLVTPIPEPSSSLMLILGSTFMCGINRRLRTCL